MSWKVRSTGSSVSLLGIVTSFHTMTLHRRFSCALHSWSYATTLSAGFGFAAVTVHGSPFTFSVKLNGGRSFSGFSSRAPRFKRVCARRPLEDTLR